MKIYKTLFALVALLASTQATFAISIGGYEISSQAPGTNTVVCTADAMLCPDGVTYVGRTGPSCSFAACPIDTRSVECVDLKNNLYLRSTDSRTNNEVTALQKFLTPKYFNQTPSGYFGRITLASVQSFQASNNILSSGYVGPITREKIKQLSCSSTLQTLAINSMSLSVANVGQAIVLKGPGLNSGGDYVLFDGYRIETDGSKALNQVGFIVPEYLSHTINCIKAPCPLGLVRQVLPGFYSIQVVNNQGSTNTVTLQVTDGTVVAPPNDTIRISWVEPSAAKVGESVIIYGYNLFRPETRILFDGYSIAGSPVYSKRAGNFNSALQFNVPGYLSGCITCKSLGSEVLPGAHKLAVDNKYDSDSVEFEVLGPAVIGRRPYLNTITPTQGVVGIEIAVYGESINRGSEKVYFGGSQVIPITSGATDQKGVIRFRIPEYITPCGYEDNTACRMLAQLVTPGKYDIVVKNDYGISNTISFTVTSGTISTPKLNSLTPSAGLIGTEVAIRGDGINVGGDQIYFGGSLVQSFSSSADVVNTLRFQVPEFITPCGIGGQNLCRIASVPVTSGKYQVAVVNSRGTSNTLSFTVTSSTSNPPTISSLSPSASVTGTQVTLTGTGFTSTGNKVNFGQSGDINGIGYNSVDGKTIRFLVPMYSSNTGWANQPGNYAVSVTNANGVSNTLNFSVISGSTNPAPSIVSLSPVVGSIGTRVTVYGSNINTNAEYVLFDGYRISTDGPKIPNQVSFLVPEYLAFQCDQLQPTDPCPAVAARQVGPGAYSVAIGNVNGVSNTLTFTVTAPGVTNIPVVTSISPARGGVGISVTISGANLTSVSDFVWFGGLKLTPNRAMKALNILVFTVPTSLSQCTSNCLAVETPTPLGSYSVKVENAKGVQSNVLDYQVTSNSPTF